MDKEIAGLRESIATAKANEKLLKANLTAVHATVSTDDLRLQITRLEIEKSETLGRLGPLRVRLIYESGSMLTVVINSQAMSNRYQSRKKKRRIRRGGSGQTRPFLERESAWRCGPMVRRSSPKGKRRRISG